jgi:ABC-type Zn uptake system ZnuABC Zn-binding protein ZnuA
MNMDTKTVVKNGRISYMALPYPLPDKAITRLKAAAEIDAAQVDRVVDKLRDEIGVWVERDFIEPINRFTDRILK